MEYVEGGTLHDCIQVSGEMSESTIRHIIRQILYALEYMHQHHQVSHRDLKPANILLCNSGLYPKIKIADLGLAKIEAGTKNNTFCGSPGYLAPECTTRGQVPGLNWAMDMYALGVITYELYPSTRQS
jgi:serine/threonine protein kinase